MSQFGTLGTAPGTFHGPRGIAQDNAGNIWVADNYNNRVEKFDSIGKFLLTFGTRGMALVNLINLEVLSLIHQGTYWFLIHRTTEFRSLIQLASS